MSNTEEDLSVFLERAKLRNNRVKGTNEANIAIDRRPTLKLGEWSWPILVFLKMHLIFKE